MKGQFSKRLLLFTWLIDFLYCFDCFIWFCIIVVKSQFSHTNESILILEVIINDERFILVNLCNANMEPE